MSNQQSYQDLRERMEKWEEIPGDAPVFRYADRVKALEMVVRDMLEVALSEKPES